MQNHAKYANHPARYQDPLLVALKLSTLKRNPLQVFRILQYLLVSYLLVDIQGTKLQLFSQPTKKGDNYFAHFPNSYYLCHVDWILRFYNVYQKFIHGIAVMRYVINFIKKILKVIFVSGRNQQRCSFLFFISSTTTKSAGNQSTLSSCSLVSQRAASCSLSVNAPLSTLHQKQCIVK